MAVQGDRPVLEEISRDFYRDLESLDIDSITRDLFGEGLIDHKFKQELKRVAKESKSEASELYLDHLIENGTILNLESFCDVLDKNSKFRPNHKRWADQLRKKLNQLQYCSVPSPVSIDEPPSSLPQEQQECQDENPQHTHLVATKGEATQTMPTTINREQKVKHVYDIYLAGEVSLPSMPDLEDEVDRILENLKQLLQAKPGKFQKVHSAIQRKHTRYIHGVRQTSLPPVPDTPEGLYEFIASKSTAFEIFLVQHAAEEMDDNTMNKELQEYKEKLAKYLEERLTSCKKRNITLPCCNERTHMAVILSEEQVLLSLVFRLKKYFAAYLHLSIEDTSFEGFTKGCTTLFFSILRADAVLLAPNVLSHSGQLKKFNVTHVIVFGYFFCDLDETTVELLHGSEDCVPYKTRITHLERELREKASKVDNERSKLEAEYKEKIDSLENELLSKDMKFKRKELMWEEEKKMHKAAYKKLDIAANNEQEAKKSLAQYMTENASLKVGIMLSQCFTQVEGVQIGKCIAGGRYGDVHEGTYRSRLVAVKRIKKLFTDKVEESKARLISLLTEFRRECNTLIAASNPHIVQLLGVFNDAMQDGGILLVMEPMDQTLEKFLKENGRYLPESRQLDISHQIASGLQFLHQCDPQIVHGNLTPKNILLDKAGEIAKLSDSGQARFALCDIPITKQTGDIHASHVEYLHGENLTDKGDIFSLGVNFLRIATQDPQILYLEEEVGTIKQWEEHLSKIADDHPLTQLILDCMKDSIEKRPTINDVCQQLSNCGVLKLYKELKKNESKVFLSDPLLKGGMLLSSRLPDLPIPTYNATALTIGCKIFVGGGICADSKAACQVQVYDTNTCKWDLLPPAPLYRSKITLVKGQLTLLGGRDAITKEMTDATSTWDEEEERWSTELPPMPKIRMRPCIIHCYNLMVVAGGKSVDNKTLFNDVDVFDTDTLQWFPSSSLRLPLPMYLMRTCISGGCIYISNGWKETSSSGSPLAYRIPMRGLYEAITKDQPGEWMQVQDTPYLESPLVVDSNQPLVVGGHFAGRPASSISLYNPDTNKWSVVGEYMRPCLRSSPIAISSSSFVVIGGCLRTTEFKSSPISDFQLLYVCQ